MGNSRWRKTLKITEREFDEIGIIGIGMLGNAVASHLLDSGFDVTVYN